MERLSNRAVVICIAVVVLAIGVFLYLNRAAFSPDVSPPAKSTVTDTHNAIKPQAAGQHTCEQSYPEEALRQKIQGTTTVAFMIDRNGSVTRPSIDTSSGSDILDKASLECVLAWRYAPAIKNGEAVEMPWKANIVWQVQADEPVAPESFTSDPLVPSKQGSPHGCPHYYPREMANEGIDGTTELGFTVTKEGAVANVHVTLSSSNATLDDAAVACAQSWRYEPAQQAGVPVPVPWTARIEFLLPSGRPRTATDNTHPMETIIATPDG